MALVFLMMHDIKDCRVESNDLIQYTISKDDEIDLKDLVCFFIRNRLKILLSTLLLFTVAVFYLLVKQPEYKATVDFMPPSDANIATLVNAYGFFGKANEITSDAVYRSLEINLISTKLKRTLFELLPKEDKDVLIGGMDSQELSFQKFSESFTVEKPKLKSGANPISIITVGFKGYNSELVASVLNRFTGLAVSHTKKELISGVTNNLDAKIAQLTEDIKLLKFNAEKKRTDEILRLKESNHAAQESAEKQIAELRRVAKQERLDRIKWLKMA
jgi:LPS O-antigen subunit length determinant protein (WzzB/FepE family)